MTFNTKIILTGALGQNPKVHTDKNGKEFAILSIATTDSFKDTDGNWQDRKTVWHNNVIAFTTKAVEQIKKLSKGDIVEITGSLDYKTMMDHEGFNQDVARITIGFVKVVKRKDSSTEEESTAVNLHTDTNGNECDAQTKAEEGKGCEYLARVLNRKRQEEEGIFEDKGFGDQWL